MQKTYYLAAILLLITCWNSVGFHQGDEHFQILEFAGYKAGLVAGEDLPWEFAEQMRPAFQPAIAYGAYRLFGLFGEPNPFWLTFVLRLVSAGLLLLVCGLFFRRYRSTFPESLTKWFLLLVLFNWGAYYSGVRFSGENWSGLFLALGFLVYPMPGQASRKHVFTPPWGGGNMDSFLAGLLFGASFLLRYQLAIAVLGFGAWLLFCGRERRQRIGLVVLGGLLMLGLGTVIDRWFYGEWVMAPWHYLRINVFEGVAATFGTRPWWGYFELVFERGVPPLSLIYLLSAAWFAYRYRRDPLTWVYVSFFVVHSMLSRKDTRFLFPLIPFIPVVVMAGMRDLRQRFGEDFYQRPWVRRVVIFFFIFNLGLLTLAAVRPMTTEVLAQRYVYNHYEEPVTLFAEGSHIYTYSKLIVRFYQRPQAVSILKSPREEWPECTTPVCLYSERAIDPKPPAGAKLVYTNRPEWLDHVPTFGLLDKNRWWWVYELERED